MSTQRYVSVYESVRNSAIWDESAIIILYDEHGGFYDHVAPPDHTPPNDRNYYTDWTDNSNAHRFNFDRLGVRVPAVIISSLIPKGTVDSRIYDHSSLFAIN